MFRKILLLIFIVTFKVCCAFSQSYLGLDSLWYKPIDMVNNTCCITDIGSSRKCLIIPNEVEIKGRKFVVTYIDDGAFAFNDYYNNFARKIATSIKYVYVGDNIRTIGHYAFGTLYPNIRRIQQVVLGKNVELIKHSVFQGCDRLKVLVSLNPTPPHIDNVNCFPTHAYDDVNVYVLDAYLKRYKEHPMWSKFWNIKGLSELSNDPNFTTAQQIEEEIAKDKAEAEAKIAAEKEMENYKNHLKPIIEKSLTDLPYIGYSIKATNKRKLINVVEQDSVNYSLHFEEGSDIEGVNFSKKVHDKWNDSNEETADQWGYQCFFDPTKDIALILITRTIKSYNGDIYRYLMMLANNGETYKIDKKLQKELRSKFFVNF